MAGPFDEASTVRSARILSVRYCGAREDNMALIVARAQICISRVSYTGIALRMRRWIPRSLH